jgi:hypothetical protein
MEVLAKRLIAQYKPDWVIVQFSPWLGERAMKILVSSQGINPSPYYFMDNEGQVQLHKPLFRWYNWYKRLKDTGDLSEDQQVLKIGFLQFFLKVGLRYYLYADFHVMRSLLGMKLGLIPRPMKDIDLLNQEAYRNIMKTAVDHSAKMIVVRLSRYSNDHEQWENLKNSLKDSPIIFVDAESALIGNLTAADKDEYFKEYAFWYGNPPEIVDSHPNPKAHRIIADTLAAAMLANLKTKQ